MAVVIPAGTSGEVKLGQQPAQRGCRALARWAEPSVPWGGWGVLPLPTPGLWGAPEPARETKPCSQSSLILPVPRGLPGTPCPVSIPAKGWEEQMQPWSS